VDLTAPNGSASTIEAHSNPPSSNPHTANGRLGESESPVLQMKRHPTEQYAMLSSPAAQQIDTPPDDQRWANRPPYAGPVAPPGPPRTDASRVPMTQRSSLGPVGIGVFGR
jgi:hypothetical protein